MGTIKYAQIVEFRREFADWKDKTLKGGFNCAYIDMELKALPISGKGISARITRSWVGRNCMIPSGMRKPRQDAVCGPSRALRQPIC